MSSSRKICICEEVAGPTRVLDHCPLHGQNKPRQKTKRSKTVAENKARIENLNNVLYAALEQEYLDGYDNGFEDAANMVKS